jgi:predicted nucleic acid-binding protein
MTARYLYDTNIVSELARPNPNAGVVKFTSTISDVMVSSILFHELTFGLETAPVDLKPRLTMFIQAIRGRFEDRAIAIDVPIADTAARLRAFAKRQGRVLTVADSLIAGTAMVHDAVVVTRNVKDFDSLSVALFNPFSEN